MGKMPTFRLGGSVEVLNLGDQHRSNACHDEKLLVRAVPCVAQTPSCYWGGISGLMEVALATSKSDVYSAKNLQTEHGELVELFWPIREKCRGIASSNYHALFVRQTAMSQDALSCDKLNNPF